MEEDPLTARELEVLTRVAGGETNRGIARNLGITERTVKAHLTHIYRKLGVDSRASAVAHALREGLLDMESGADLS
jgi:DNA-binding NarL/FixJ family response regulator